MRSRNGNRPFIFSSLALITTLIYGTDNYYIGYRLTTQNAQPIEETFSLSKAMQPCPQNHGSSLSLQRHDNESLETVLNHDRTLFLEYAASQDFHLKSDETLTSSQLKSIQTLTLPTQCYAVEFNGDLVTITLLK